MIAKLLLQNTIFVVALGALLFASAGTLHWPAAWVFLVVSAILGPACGLWLAKTDPALLAERMRPTFQADQPAADKKFMLTFVLVAQSGWTGARRHPTFHCCCKYWGLRCICSRTPSSCGCFAKTPLPHRS